MKLQWKVAIVTGAASGIGAHAARLFPSEGPTVVCVDRDHHGANAVVNEIPAAGGRGLAPTVDVASDAAVTGMAAPPRAEYGRPDRPFTDAAVTRPAYGDAKPTP